MKNLQTGSVPLVPTSNTSKPKQKLVWYFVSAAFAVILISLSFFIFYKLKIINYKFKQQPEVVVVVPTPTPDPDRPVSYLLLGYAGANHDGGGLTDSIILSQIRPHDQQINLISIPRDLWVEASPDNFAKINSVLPLQGPAALKDLVASISGQKVENYLAVDFAGFVKVVDLLGGIDLKITRPFVDNFYPIDVGTTDTCGKSAEEILALEATMSGDKLNQQFTCRYESLIMNVGTTHLDGATALKYARSRHSEFDGGDFNRSNRQRQVLLAIRDKALNLNIFTKVISIYQTIKSHLRTDLTIADIEKILLRIVEFSHYRVTSVSLNDKNVLKQSVSVNHQSILIPTGGISQYQPIQEFIASSSSSPGR